MCEVTCGECVYWNQRAGTRGDCRRYPTAVVKRADSWCGEFCGCKALVAVEPECCAVAADAAPAFFEVIGPDYAAREVVAPHE